MIQVTVATLSADAISGQPVLLLRPVDVDPDEEVRVLPIWIGHPEATSIMLALEEINLPRPMTHDLMYSVIGSLGFFLERVEITRLDGGTFYAALIMRGEERMLTVDSRPSDGIALAVRTGCPIFVAEEVMAEASVLLEDSDEDEVEAFRDFLEHVDPNDFMS